MTFWMIYDHPSDYPTKWVLRAHDVPGGPRLKLETAATLKKSEREFRRSARLHQLVLIAAIFAVFSERKSLLSLMRTAWKRLLYLGEINDSQRAAWVVPTKSIARPGR